jgi:hypothetical protein
MASRTSLAQLTELPHPSLSLQGIDPVPDERTSDPESEAAPKSVSADITTGDIHIDDAAPLPRLSITRTVLLSTGMLLTYFLGVSEKWDNS